MMNPVTTPANPPADLVAFIRAQLDEDERVARAAGAGQWTRECGHVGIDDEDLPPGHDLCAVVSGDIHIYDEGGHTPEQAEHIARHDPARVLAEVNAKRRIVDLHPYAGLRSAPESCGSCVSYPGPCNTLRLLALPFADRPGFREEWKPT